MLKNTLKLIIPIVLLGSLPFCTPHTDAPIEKTPAKLSFEELKKKIEKIRVETKQPAIGIALADKNGVHWVAGLGETDAKTHTKANENTMFRVASVSKMFSGLAILKLVEDGKIRLNDKLHDIAPDLAYENAWEKTNPILISHLLEHTTGWNIKLNEYTQEPPDTLSLKLGLADPARVKARTSRWIPGTRHAYSNTGPVVAAYVVEKVTNMRFEDYVQKNLLNPIGMNSTTYFKNAQWDKRGVTAYVDGKTEKYAFMYSRPASSVNTTPADMAKLLQLFIKRGTIDSVPILRPETIKQMETPFTTLGASKGIASGYSLTMEIKGYKNSNTAFYGHGGYIPGNITEFMYAPELQAGFVLMLNANNGEAYTLVMNTLRDYLLQDVVKKTPTPIALPEKFRKLEGLYRLESPSGDIFRIKSDIMDVVTLSADEKNKTLRVEPFMDGAIRSYYALNDKNLVSSWTGLPSLAMVEDPLLGETVQINGDLYQRISALSLYAHFSLLIGVLVFSLLSVLFAFIWIPRLLMGRIKKGGNIQVRVFPLLTSIVLLLAPITLSFLPNDPTAISPNPVTIAIFIISILYPILTVYSLFILFKNRKLAMNSWIYRYSALLSFIHLLFALYLASYGFLAFRIWV